MKELVLFEGDDSALLYRKSGSMPFEVWSATVCADGSVRFVLRMLSGSYEVEVSASEILEDWVDSPVLVGDVLFLE